MSTDTDQTTLTLMAPPANTTKDMQTVLWLLSNVATSKQATREERIAAMQAMRAPDNVNKLLNMPNLSLWEIAGAVLDFFLYKKPPSVLSMSMYSVMLPDPSVLSVQAVEIEGKPQYVLDLSKVHRSPVMASVVISDGHDSIVGDIPWVVTFCLELDGLDIEYIQVEASFRPLIGPDIEALSITYH